MVLLLKGQGHGDFTNTSIRLDMWIHLHKVESSSEPFKKDVDVATPVAADRDHFSSYVIGHAPVAAAGILQIA